MTFPEDPQDPKRTLRPPPIEQAFQDPEDTVTASSDEMNALVRQLMQAEAEKSHHPTVELFRSVFAAPSVGHGLQQEERVRVLAAGWRACGLDRGAIICKLDDCMPTPADDPIPSHADLEQAYQLLETASGRIPAEVLEPTFAFIRLLLKKSCGVDPGPPLLRPQEGNWPTPFIPPEVVALAGLMPLAQPSVVDVTADDPTTRRTIQTAADLRARGHDIVDWFRRTLHSNAPLPFQYLGIAVGWDVPIHEEQWFIGDLHGDLLALECALEVIDRLSLRHPPHIVLLGDVFDDGGYSVETVLRVLELGSARPGTLTWIAGNHDDAFAFDESNKMYFSTVIPCDFANQVNQSPEGSCDRAVASVVAWLAPRLPRALLFEDGLLASHGGVPLPDLWPMISTGKDLARPEALRDFTWARAHDRVRNRFPARISRTSDFGRDDLAMFGALMSRLLDGRPVHRLIRGHDHIIDRFHLHPTYQRMPMRTINTLSRRLPREVYGGYARTPVVARHRAGETPVIYRIHIPRAAVLDTYSSEADRDTETGKTC